MGRGEIVAGGFLSLTKEKDLPPSVLTLQQLGGKG